MSEEAAGMTALEEIEAAREAESLTAADLASLKERASTVGKLLTACVPFVLIAIGHNVVTAGSLHPAHGEFLDTLGEATGNTRLRAAVMGDAAS